MEQQKLVFSEKPHKEDKAHQKEKKILFLKDIVSIVTSKVSVDEVDIQNYISTENMIPNLGGIFESDSKPLKGNITAFKKNDILISNIRPYLKKIWYSDKDGGCSSDVLVLRTINEKIDQKYLFYILSSDKFFNYVMSTSKGTKMPRGDKKAILKFKVPITYIENQKQYSNFLTIIDKKIELLEKKIDYSKELKNYFLNSLIFEQFSDNYKHFRFEEFEDNWIYKSLEKVSVVKDGTHDSPKYHSEGFPLITSKNLLNNATLNMENVNFISKEDFDKINKRSKVDCGDILFGMIGTIGNPVIVKEEGFAIKNVALIKEKGDLKNDFLIHVLDSNIIKKQFYKLNAGGTQKFIALNLIRNLKVPVPSINEQNQISNFLNLFDKKTYLYSKELENMNNFKKGLLQKMFV